MATEKLSKLQKWILVSIYERDQKEIYRRDIYEDYYNVVEDKKRYSVFRIPQPERSDQVKKVAPIVTLVTLSLRNLIKKDLIKCYSGYSGKETNHELYSHIKIKLTEKGKKKGLLLLNCRNESTI